MPYEGHERAAFGNHWTSDCRTDQEQRQLLTIQWGECN